MFDQRAGVFTQTGGNFLGTSLFVVLFKKPLTAAREMMKGLIYQNNSRIVQLSSDAYCFPVAVKVTDERRMRRWQF